MGSGALVSKGTHDSSIHEKPGGAITADQPECHIECDKQRNGEQHV